jgi:hypothetical protein
MSSRLAGIITFLGCLTLSAATVPAQGRGVVLIRNNSITNLNSLPRFEGERYET